MKKQNIDLSIILPCRNEEKALGLCLKEIKEIIKLNKLKAEVIVSDSSNDSSPKIALNEGAILIKHNEKGYGNAYLEAFKIAKGRYLFMTDPDGSYDYKQLPIFIEYLREGNDLIIGNRFKGKMEKNSMLFTHKYIGSPFLSLLLKIFFKSKIQDSNSGIRAIKKESLEKLKLKTTGMEFASEMIVKAIKNNLKIKEIPTNYKKRLGNSKLRTIMDGLRHLKFILVYRFKLWK